MKDSNPQLPDTPDAPLLDKLGWSKFLLILSDWAKTCRTRGILLGPGRGSAAASPTLRALGVVCPTLPETPWQRFLSGGRIPDIDIDVASSQRADAVRAFETCLPSGWRMITGLNKDGRPGTGLFAVPMDDMPDTRDAHLMEQAGLLKIDLLPSRELDAIALGRAITAHLDASIGFSDWTGQPRHLFVPRAGVDWTPRARPEDWRIVNQCPAAFFQLTSGRLPKPIRSYEDAMDAIALIRPDAHGDLIYHEDAMARLVDAHVADWDTANRLRHMDRDEAEPIIKAADKAEVGEAARFLNGGYGFCRAHAAAYAAILDMEARIATANPYAWASGLYDINPERFRDGRLDKLTGPWTPDPDLGAFFGGVAHLKGVGAVQARAMRMGEAVKLTPRPRGFRGLVREIAIHGTTRGDKLSERVRNVTVDQTPIPISQAALEAAGAADPALSPDPKERWTAGQRARVAKALGGDPGDVSPIIGPGEWAALDRIADGAPLPGDVGIARAAWGVPDNPPAPRALNAEGVARLRKLMPSLEAVKLKTLLEDEADGRLDRRQASQLAALRRIANGETPPKAVLDKLEAIYGNPV